MVEVERCDDCSVSEWSSLLFVDLLPASVMGTSRVDRYIPAWLVLLSTHSDLYLNLLKLLLFVELLSRQEEEWKVEVCCNQLQTKTHSKMWRLPPSTLNLDPLVEMS